MRIIGITGGVGAGKTEILSYIETHYRCRVLRADEAAHRLEEPHQPCYDSLVALLGEGILKEDKTIDRGKMAAVIFADKEILQQVNAIIHPQVKRYILDEIARERERGAVDYFFIEAALLIEEHYDLIVDELWYIHADEAVRRQRLADSRHYSDSKISEIIRGQLGEADFRKHCQVVITNNGNIEDTYQQITKIMGDCI